MKFVFSASIIMFIMALPLFINAQIITDESYRTFHPRIEMSFEKSSFNTGNTILPISLNQKISGLSISGSITFTGEKGFVRIILTDDYDNEYLVLETNTIFENKFNISFDEFCEETALLNNVFSKQITIESTDAQVVINGIQYAVVNEFQISRSKQIREEQMEVKIDYINAVLVQKGITWGAGKTALSEMSYMEKKSLFCGTLPNLAGFDYYVSGIYVMQGYTPNNLSSLSTTQNQFVQEFDWRNRHGRNWMTPAINQGGCGSCWAFASVGATEPYTNLYYNRLLNLDLSEQDVLSCSGAGNCPKGGYIDHAFNYLRNSGVVNETCFTYSASDLPCGNKCTNPNEKIKIGNFTIFNQNQKTPDDLKKLVIQTPTTFGITSWWHFLVLVGYKTIQSGDKIYIKTQKDSYWITIPSSHPLIGSDAWILKNSHGNRWGYNGFGYVVTNWSEVYGVISISEKITCLNYTDADIICEDRDGDGYYFWGIGKKPACCPPGAPNEPDGDDSNPNLGPMDAYGNCTVIKPSFSKNVQ